MIIQHFDRFGILYKHSLVTLIAIILISFPHPILADNVHQDGWNAMAKHDYKTAHKLCLPLAEEGNALSQTCMGFLYADGLGVPKDAQEAFKWFRLAAEQGDGLAQVRVGVGYIGDERSPGNHILAYMWLSLSAAQGFKSAVPGINLLEKAMTPSDIEKARVLARNWEPTPWKELSKHLIKTSCIEAFKTESGITLGTIVELEKVLGAKIQQSPLPGGVGGMYKIMQSVRFQGKTSEFVWGYYLREKASTVSFTFEEPLDIQAFTDKYWIQVKTKTLINATFECEEGITLFIGQVEKGGKHGAWIKNNREIAHIIKNIK